MGTEAKAAHAEGLLRRARSEHTRSRALAGAPHRRLRAQSLSPIDLIPDFIPVLGYLDDLLIIPLGLALVVRLTPPKVMESAREKASQVAARPVIYTAAIVIVLLWLLLALVFARWVLKLYNF